MTRNFSFVVAVITAAILLQCMAVVVGPAQAQQSTQAPPAAVEVVTVQPQRLTMTTTLPGRVVASAVAEVRPQVAGLIIDRQFREGSWVEEGDVLFTIDAASYEARLAQAEAAVAQADAQYTAANRDAERVARLKERNVTSQQVADDAIAARDAAAAAMKVAQAQLQSAQIELDRTTIRAPLSGEIGLARTNRGALVTASQAEPLAVIRRIDQVYVDVTQSAADLLAWRRGHTEAALENADREITLILADGSQYSQNGLLTAAEPFVDELTGVVVLRIDFPNPDTLLLPGMYVQVNMPLGVEDNRFLVPQEGVSRDRRGRPIALVVGGDEIVEERKLEISGDQASDWIVESGLNPGDRVIVSGLQRAAPGAKVTVQERVETPPVTD